MYTIVIINAIKMLNDFKSYYTYVVREGYKMISIYTIISEARIPDQLKLYLNDSKAMEEFIDEEKISILEELTTYFYSLYTFDTPQYCAAVVSAFRKSKDVGSFYDFLKSVIEVELKLMTKEYSLNHNDYSVISSSHFNNVFKEASVLFIKSIEKISKKEEVNLALIYIFSGKINLILDITNELHFYKLKETADYIISESRNTNNSNI